MAVMDGAALGALAVFGVAFIAFLFVLLVAMYIYVGITLTLIAKKTKTEPSWLAWIPIANVFLLPKMAKMHWWPALVLIVGVFFGMLSSIPIVGLLFVFLYFVAAIIFLVFWVIWVWKICERLQRPGWLVLLIFVPLLGIIWGFILFGILAWDESAVETASTKTLKAEPEAAPVKKVVAKKSTVKKKTTKTVVKKKR